MIFISLVLFVLFLLYLALKSNYNYWHRKGVPYPEPKFLVGNIGPCFLFRKSFGDVVTEIYNQFRNAPLVGMFRGTTPVIIVRDPEIIKEVVIKNFSHFHDNDIHVSEELDPIFGRNPFVLKGEKWKVTRAQLTPCFTSGKMKALYPILEEICQQLVKYVDKELENGNTCLEAKELCTKFTLNNVASCAFGLDGKCFEDPNSEFRQLAHKFLTPSSWSSMVFLFTFLVPSVTKLFKVKMVKKEVEDKLLEIVTETLRYRRENNIVRNDFLDSINHLKDSCKDYEFTDIDVTAHAASFFGDGYETSSIVMSFILYQLASNPEEQKILREEVTKAFEADKEHLKYETLQSLKYLEGVYLETLRLHPIIYFLMKTCTKEFTYYPTNGIISKPVTIEKDTSVILPLGGLHRDPAYFENPDKFMPERFLEENRQSINKFAYLPFGEGPRACLGQRFGNLQIKCGIAYIIRNFELSVNSKTKRPLKYDPFYFMLSPIGGLWLDYKRIKN